ncbi:DNA starvation/stationary phase protection protein [Nocardia sp. NPDC049190]|uniref:Dps family protein n=1 Tax=Nocardia sp. NPDC049190 TaxID=3155650 RepID=UPI0033C4B77A
MTEPITSTLDPEQQRIAGETLRATVIDLIDLSLIAEQAHWNVVGADFHSAHLALDELVTAAREFTDAAVERAITIGVRPDVRGTTVVEDPGTIGISGGGQPDTDAVDTIAGNVSAVIERLRERIAATEKADPVSQDLFLAITTRLELLHGMWQAQLAAV